MRIWGDQASEPLITNQAMAWLNGLNLPEDFSIVDIACGRGDAIREIKKAYPSCNAFGVDIDSFPEWDNSVRFIQTPLQDFIKRPSRWDVVIMLNSYRNWEGSDRVAFDKWVGEYTEHFLSI